jgi:hypothetical protein
MMAASPVGQKQASSRGPCQVRFASERGLNTDIARCLLSAEKRRQDNKATTSIWQAIVYFVKAAI